MKAQLAAGPHMVDAADLADPHLHARYDLDPVWDELRTRSGILWHPPKSRDTGFWVMTRHSDVSAVYRDPATFSSAGGNVLDVMLDGGDSAGGRMVSVSDGQYHAEVRRVLMKGFTPEALAATGRRVEAAVRGLVADALERPRCDFARDVAAAIPLQAICDLLGVSEADQRFILEHTSSSVGSESPTATAVDAWRAKNEILFYFAQLAEQRRAVPVDDVVTMLVQADIRGRRLASDEIIFNCYSLILGGDETTRLGIVGAALAFAQHEDALSELRSGRVSIDDAVEEILRWTTPSMHQARIARADVDWRGERIREGDIVTLWNVAANRDASVFDRPGEFRIGRTGNRHLTFAAGTHYCLGAHLARLEIAATLRTLRDMVARVELLDVPSPVFSNFLGGYSRLPVRLHPYRQ
ncbi:cytochrome P450 [Actinoplanes sp. NPDC049265]|uniref:cytochrome P450 n=1 Tax=Actinoplanes sp. NPDC049265 TaxID=3363902 RepID=UPI003711BADB